MWLINWHVQEIILTGEFQMDFDDLPKKKNEPTAALEKEDLSEASVDQLEERIAILKAEISRTEQEIVAKKASRAAADAFFGS